MKLELTRPHPANTVNSKDIPIPTQFKMEQRPQRKRTNVKHGTLTELKDDKLLVFHDKPSFPVGSHVEALDNSRNRHSDIYHHDDEEEKDKKTKNKKKNMSLCAIKGYSKGVIKEINNDRTFTVEFNKTKKRRYKVPERDIRFEDIQESQRANKCKIWGTVNGEMDMMPIWTKEYKQFLTLRSMQKFSQHTMKIKHKVNKFGESEEVRQKEAERIIRLNKNMDAKNVRSHKAGTTTKKKKRIKNVRKDDKIYENMIFAAFEKESLLNQKEIETKTNEPWNFLRPIVQKLCDRHNNTSKGGRTWVLKPEYRLATDTAIETEQNKE